MKNVGGRARRSSFRSPVSSTTFALRLVLTTILHYIIYATYDVDWKSFSNSNKLLVTPKSSRSVRRGMLPVFRKWGGADVQRVAPYFFFWLKMIFKHTTARIVSQEGGGAHDRAEASAGSLCRTASWALSSLTKSIQPTSLQKSYWNLCGWTEVRNKFIAYTADVFEKLYQAKKKIGRRYGNLENTENENKWEFASQYFDIGNLRTRNKSIVRRNKENMKKEHIFVETRIYCCTSSL